MKVFAIMKREYSKVLKFTLHKTLEPLYLTEPLARIYLEIYLSDNPDEDRGNYYIHECDVLDKEDTDIKKIYVALGNTQRMGLIEYKVKDTITLNNFKEEGM